MWAVRIVAWAGWWPCSSENDPSPLMLKVKMMRSGLRETEESEDASGVSGPITGKKRCPEEERQVRIMRWSFFCLTSFPSEQEIGCKGLDFPRGTKGIIRHTCCSGKLSRADIKAEQHLDVRWTTGKGDR